MIGKTKSTEAEMELQTLVGTIERQAMEINTELAKIVIDYARRIGRRKGNDMDADDLFKLYQTAIEDFLPEAVAQVSPMFKALREDAKLKTKEEKKDREKVMENIKKRKTTDKSNAMKYDPIDPTSWIGIQRLINCWSDKDYWASKKFKDPKGKLRNMMKQIFKGYTIKWDPYSGPLNAVKGVVKTALNHGYYDYNSFWDFLVLVGNLHRHYDYMIDAQIGTDIITHILSFDIVRRMIAEICCSNITILDIKPKNLKKIKLKKAKPLPDNKQIDLTN